MERNKLALLVVIAIVALIVIGYKMVKIYSPQFVWRDIPGTSSIDTALNSTTLASRDPNYVVLGTFASIEELKAMVNNNRIYDRICYVSKAAPKTGGIGVAIKIGTPNVPSVPNALVTTSVIASNESSINKIAAYLDPLLGWMN